MTPSEFFDIEASDPSRVDAIVKDLKRLNDIQLDTIATLVKDLARKAQSTEFTTWQAVHLFPQMLERDFRRCRQKSLSLLVGVAPQTPLSAPLPGLAARSVPERWYPCFAGKGGLAPFR